MILSPLKSRETRENVPFTHFYHNYCFTIKNGRHQKSTQNHNWPSSLLQTLPSAVVLALVWRWSPAPAPVSPWWQWRDTTTRSAFSSLAPNEAAGSSCHPLPSPRNYFPCTIFISLPAPGLLTSRHAGIGGFLQAIEIIFFSVSSAFLLFKLQLT